MELKTLCNGVKHLPVKTRKPLITPPFFSLEHRNCVPCGRAGACRLAALLVLLAMTVALPAQAQTTDNFYLWRTTITVGENSGYLGYDESDSLGSISTSADLYFPPFSPPPKHHFDPESAITVEAIKSYDAGGALLEVHIGNIDRFINALGNVGRY